jgi:hypothetical protein
MTEPHPGDAGNDDEERDGLGDSAASHGSHLDPRTGADDDRPERPAGRSAGDREPVDGGRLVGLARPEHGGEEPGLVGSVRVVLGLQGEPAGWVGGPGRRPQGLAGGRDVGGVGRGVVAGVQLEPVSSMVTAASPARLRYE